MPAAPVRSPRALIAAVAVAMATAPAAPALYAQAVGPPATPAAEEECFGFSFGAWTPALDARAAGHRPAAPEQPPRPPEAQASGGRDWAIRLGAGRDTTLLLFPAWWPAGVAVRFPDGIDARRDTVRGTATAFVADGRAPRRRARRSCSGAYGAEAHSGMAP